MFNSITQLFSLLTSKQKHQLIVLQFLVAVMALLEVLAITSIVPFMTLVSDLSIVNGEGFIAKAYLLSEFGSPSSFLIASGLFVLFTLITSSLYSIWTYRKLILFANRFGFNLSSKLYKNYLNMNWLFHASHNSAQLTKNVSTEASRIAEGVILPLLQINARLVIIIFISITVFLYNPVVATLMVLILTIAYIVIFQVVKNRLRKNGEAVSKLSTERFKLINEGFGGIKDILLLGRKDDFIDQFSKTSHEFSMVKTSNILLGQLPKYLMEMVAFGTMISFILIVAITQEFGSSMVLPVISLYGLAALKLLPAMQQSYVLFSNVKSHLPAFEALKEDLMEEHKQAKSLVTSSKIIEDKMAVENGIVLSNIDFKYPSKSDKALNQVSITIPKNHSIGIVGASGSGKSTLIDILLGLIQPQEGSLIVDGITINEHNLRTWQNSIGFVPQSIFLSEGTISENVAFGLAKDLIDLTRVKKALQLAHLKDFIDGLPGGLNTKVGERGVQLSGGQRQRIGIARALYHETSLLVFDEATSALDGITENIIMEAIKEFQGQKTLVMIAHRLKTVKDCDQIYFMEKGKIVDQGTYQELVQRNEQFRNMAKHA